MKIFNILILIVCVFTIKAQTINTSFNFDDTSVEIEETVGLVIKDDTYYILGLARTYGLIPWSLGPTLFTVNKEGDLVNKSIKKQYDKNIYTGLDHCFFINDNEFIFATSVRVATGTESKALITSYDNMLNINWQRIFFEDFSAFRTVQLTAEGDYLVLGKTQTIGNGKTDILLMKLDNQGNEIWTKTFGGVDNDRGVSLAILEDGNYLIGGAHYDSFPDGDGWLIKTDTAGNVLWDKYYGGVGAEYGMKIFGDKYFYQSKDSLHLHVWDGNYGVEYFGEFDEFGNVLWTEELERKNLIVIRNAIKLEDGGILIVTDYIDTTLQQQINYLIKYDAERNIVWDRYYIADNAIANNLIDVEEDEEGFLVFAGGFVKEDSIYNSDIWLLKLNSEGCLDNGDCGEPIGILDLTIAREKFKIQVNPNPVKKIANILVKNSTNFIGKEMQLSIYSPQGKIKYETSQNLRGQLPIFQIDCQNWQKGIFFVKINVEGKEYGQVKFLVE